MPRQIIGRRPDSLHERRRALPRPSDSPSRHPPPVTIPGAQRMLSGIFSTLKRNCQLIHACSAGQHGKTPDSLHLPIPSLDGLPTAFLPGASRCSLAGCSDRPFTNALYRAWLGLAASGALKRISGSRLRQTACVHRPLGIILVRRNP